MMEDMLTTEYDGCGRCLVGLRRSHFPLPTELVISAPPTVVAANYVVASAEPDDDRTSSPKDQGNQILRAADEVGGAYHRVG